MRRDTPAPQQKGPEKIRSAELLDASGLDWQLRGLAQDVELYHHAAFAVGHLVDGLAGGEVVQLLGRSLSQP
jgi:hypothetical protein